MVMLSLLIKGLTIVERRRLRAEMPWALEGFLLELMRRDYEKEEG
jgi:hypothetical protein